MEGSLTWDSTYEIVLALKKAYPNTSLEEVSLNDIFRMTIGLENFQDDPGLANDKILEEIYLEWFEESL